jgi:acyl-CoA thioester hydrolase
MQQQEQNSAGATGATVRHRLQLRVRYSETDQLGTYYNSRALEWFEVGRTELMRACVLPYVEWEARGVQLPLVEAHVNYRGRAKYNDLLNLEVAMCMAGRASLRFEVQITQAVGGAAVADGYTVHAMTDPAGRPMRPPIWLMQKLRPGS